MTETTAKDNQISTNLNEPIEEFKINGAKITVLGTAHVSRESERSVKNLISSRQYDLVAIELCEGRYRNIQNPDAFVNLDLWKVIKEKKTALIAANLILGAYQNRIAEQHNVAAGAEMLAAIKYAEKFKLSIDLIDRDIGITLKRTASSLSWWKRFNLFTGLFYSLISKDQVDEKQIENLKNTDTLEEIFSEFSTHKKEMFVPLISERDLFMSAKIFDLSKENPGKNILAIVGAGHLKGIKSEIKNIEDSKKIIEQLNRIPKKSKFIKIFPWIIVFIILTGFFIGFSKSTDLGIDLIFDWIIINGGLSALGAILAGAHPLTIIIAFLSAPLTSLNPTIGAGMVSAGAELIIRKPQVKDFKRLREETTKITGWWKNRVSRTILIFIFCSLGSAIGTYFAGFQIFEKLTN